MLGQIQGSVNRTFIPSSYDNNDSLAKDTIIKYLIGKGHTIISSEENFSFDITSEKDGKTYYSEVEIKTQWSGEWNPSWKEIRIPYRKHKLINKFKELDDGNAFLTFYVIRRDCQYAWGIEGSILAASDAKEVSGPTRGIAKGEYFFHIPYQDANLVKIGEA
jgi:hypothetical protein